MELETCAFLFWTIEVKIFPALHIRMSQMLPVVVCLRWLYTPPRSIESPVELGRSRDKGQQLLGSRNVRNEIESRSGSRRLSDFPRATCDGQQIRHFNCKAVDVNEKSVTAWRKRPNVRCRIL